MTDMLRSPARVPREGDHDGDGHHERHQQEAEIRHRVRAVAEAGRDARRAGKRGARTAGGDSEQGDDGGAPHSRYTATNRAGQRPTTKCQYIAHACTGVIRPSPNRARVASSVVATTHTRAPATCRPCSPMSE